MEWNPYQPPLTDSSPIVAAPDLRIDGKYIVVRSNVALPPICVKTGEPVGWEDMRLLRLSWCPPFILPLVLLFGCIGVLFYFTFRKQCAISFGLTPALRRKRTAWRYGTFAVALLLFLAIPVAAANFDSPIPAIVISTLFAVAFCAILLQPLPLRVAKYGDGEYWISGCSAAFISQVLDESHA